MNRLPTPYYHDEGAGITIYCADNRDVLPYLEAESVDLVLTDPPYGIGFDYGSDYEDCRDGYIDWLWPVIEVAEECVRETGYIGVFQSVLHARHWSVWFPREWQLMAIPKTFGQMGRLFVPTMTDYVLLWSREQAPQTPQDWQPRGFRNWFLAQTSVTRRGPERDHPCPRPIDAMRYLVSGLCPPLGLALDPFMGSGTTLRAAKDLGRRAIGIEIDERYCEIAVKRLRQAVLPLGGAA